jgi:thiol-disulfide isomerase/thioredoxin
MAILAGLLAGVIVGGLALGAYVVYGPDLLGPASTFPVSASATASPPAPASGSPGITASASATGGATPTAVPTPAASVDLGAAFHIGEPAPPLRVPRLGGGEIDLASLRGKPVWVVFMATWCPSCVDEFPVMNGFAARYEEEGLVVIAVDLQEPEDRVAAFVDQFTVVFPVGLDPDGAAADAWGVLVPPIHFWVDTEGVVRDGALGGIGPDIMATGLERVMPGVDVEP